MCCFSRAVVQVTGTRIFARAMDDVHQALVYSLKLAADEALQHRLLGLSLDTHQ